jgi:alpha-tubulin suppressor-like RCC1 family protein
VRIPELDDTDKIEFLICKFNSSAVLDSDNNLYYWGDDFDGFRERIPEKKELFDQRIVDISFGYRHALILLEDGSVYSWGDGKILIMFNQFNRNIRREYFTR